MTNKNRIRVFLLSGGLFVALWTISVSSAHEGHKHSNAPASAKRLKNPLKVSEASIEAGRVLFNRHCASCHGEDGKSKTEIAASMKKTPTDLTAKEMRGITDGEIYWVIANGVTKSGMPPFKTKMKVNERWQTTLYVKHLMGEHPPAGHAGDHAIHEGDAHHTAVNERGDKVMGFSHEKTAHHFRLKSDGGVIEVEANDPADSMSIDRIKTHLKHIAQKFTAGDFEAPMLIHGTSPPGIAVMKRQKAEINYNFEESERGGRIQITTGNAEAVTAIHQFLRFQITDHRTGDSGEKEKTH
jgi:mono/diheme cytochrome c family protein